VTWLAVDGNHENFHRLLGGEFPVVEIYGGKAYQIRRNVYYLKRGELFTIDGQSFLAFGGAASCDKDPGWYEPPLSHYGFGGKEWNPGRTEGINWWPQEIPSPEDFENACRNLDRVNWTVDHVLTHTCPLSRRNLFQGGSSASDPTEVMLQELHDRLSFKTWRFGHFHLEKQVDNFVCHYNRVRLLTDFIAAESGI